MITILYFDILVDHHVSEVLEPLLCSRYQLWISYLEGENDMFYKTNNTAKTSRSLTMIAR